MLTRREKMRKAGKRIWHQLTIRNSRPVPVFIFGEMRSGTNMLTDCFDRSLSTAVFNETDDEAFEGYALRSNEIIGNLINDGRATHVIFKSLADSGRAVELLDQFNPAKAIWIFRDYEDVVNSALKKWTEHRRYLEYILESPEEDKWRATGLPADSLELISDYYHKGIDDRSARALIWYVRNKLYFDQALNERDDVYLVRYEELVKNPHEVFSGAFQFLGLVLKPTYFRAVSQQSVRRDPPPALDSEVQALCEAMRARLIQALESARTTGTGLSVKQGYLQRAEG